MTPSRKNSPALYELVGNDRPRPVQVSVRPARIDDDTARDVQHATLEGELRPGGTVRMPAGAIFLMVFLIVFALIAGYLIGYNQKAREVRADQTEAALEHLDEGLDPLNRIPVNPNLVDADEQENDARPRENRPAQPENGDSEPVSADQNASRTLIVEGDIEDPRVRGLNYLAVTSMGAERVEAFLDYLAREGVDAAAYPVNNGVYRIYALQGFSRDEYRANREPFERGLQRITDAYRDAAGRGVTYDPFWDKH